MYDYSCMYIKPLFCCFVVSLQDINMRKAFKSSTVQDQQVLSTDSASNSVAELYNSCDRPPPLSTLTAYRWNTILQVLVSCWTFLSNKRFLFCIDNTDKTPQMQWDSTQTLPTSLNCGRRKCFGTQRTRGKRGGGRGWVHTVAFLRLIGS